MPGSWSVELKELIRNVERMARLESLQLLPPYKMNLGLHKMCI